MSEHWLGLHKFILLLNDASFCLTKFKLSMLMYIEGPNDFYLPHPITDLVTYLHRISWQDHKM